MGRPFVRGCREWDPVSEVANVIANDSVSSSSNGKYK